MGHKINEKDIREVAMERKVKDLFVVRNQTFHTIGGPRSNSGLENINWRTWLDRAECFLIAFRIGSTSHSSGQECNLLLLLVVAHVFTVSYHGLLSATPEAVSPLFSGCEIARV
jgi:hypothetical protein